MFLDHLFQAITIYILEPLIILHSIVAIEKVEIISLLFLTYALFFGTLFWINDVTLNNFRLNPLASTQLVVSNL